MNESTITCQQFYFLHECIIEQAEKMLKKEGGLEKSSDEYFYGYGKEGQQSNTSINHVVVKTLKSKKYDFSKFRKDDNGEPKFNKDLLRKAKKEYNDKKEEIDSGMCKIFFPQIYVKAFLFFIGYNSINELTFEKQDLPIQKIIDPAGTYRFPTKRKKGNPQFFNEDRNLPNGWEKAIKQKLENTKWCLYTYNYNHNRIVRAILKIEALGDGHNCVRLKNPKGAYEYIGTINCRLAYHRVIQFDLVTEFADDKHLHSKFYINFTRKGTPSTKKGIPLMLGKQIGYGHHHDINCTNAILQKTSKSDEPQYFDPPYYNLHQAIVRFLDPSEDKFSVIPRHTFSTLDGLLKWIIKPNEYQPKHFKKK